MYPSLTDGRKGGEKVSTNAFSIRHAHLQRSQLLQPRLREATTHAGLLNESH